MRFEDVLILRDKVSETTKKITKGFKNVQKEGTKAQMTMQKLGAIGKKAMLGLVAGVTVVYGATAKLVQETAKYGDRVDKMSQKIGISRKSFQEWDFILSQNGGSVDSLQMGMKAMSNQLDGVAKGSKESIRYFQQLGVKVKDSSGQFRKQEDIFNDVIFALGKMDNETQKTIIANKLFGRSANDLKPLLNQTSDTIEKQRKQAHDLGLVMKDDAIDSAVKFTDTLDQAKRALAGVGYEIGAELMPSVTELTQEIIANREQIKQVISGIVMVAKVVGTAIGGIASFFQSLGGFIGTLIGKILSIPTNIAMAFDKVKFNIIMTFLNIKKAVTNVIENIINKIRPLINAVKVVKSGIQGLSLGNATKAGGTYTSNQSNRTTNTNYYQNQNTLNFSGTVREEADIDKIGDSIARSLLMGDLNRGGAY